MKSPERMLTCCAGAVALFLASPQLATAADVDCMDTESALNYWRPLHEEASTTDLPADALATELVACLGSPNPELRDGIAYELFTYWLRQEKLSDVARRDLLVKLSEGLASEQTLRRSFSALILAELLRSDANTPFMTTSERSELLNVATQALEREPDFRGLEPDLGWVHPVAHMADLQWRFALHPETSHEQALLILTAIRSKVAPTEVAYAFNEGDRLARAVSTVIRRGLLDPALVGEWIAEFQMPRSMTKWSDAFQSPSGMAELHNTKQFLRALSDQLATDEPDPAISEPLNALVTGFTQLI